MKRLLLFFLAIALTSCTLIPSKEWFKSDTLDTNIKVSDISGKYIPSKDAIKKLEKIFNSKQIDSLKKSFIYISSKDSIILGDNLPLNLDYHGDYKISSGKGKIYVLNNNHEKYRFLPRPDGKWPDMHFRIRNGKKGILVNLSLDADGWDYYEYILQE